MNWVEAIFGVSPDGGNGMVEVLLAVGTAVALATVALGRRRFVRSRRAKLELG